MIARGAVGNPWIFEQILLLDRGLAAPGPELSDRKQLIAQHFQLLSEIRGERRAARAMRGLLLQYTKGLPHSAQFRGTITHIKDLESLRRITDRYFGMLRSTEE